MAPSDRPSFFSSRSNETRGPMQQEFDSLQDLLEQAGYKETRIFTPASFYLVKAQSTPPGDVKENETGESVREDKVVQGPSSNWFRNIWRSKEINMDDNDIRRKSLNRKQSEPVLSRRSKKALQKSWWGTTGLEDGDDHHNDFVHYPPDPLQSRSLEQASESRKVSVELSGETGKTHRPPLRHAPSTGELWRGSLHHHRSFPSKMQQKEPILKRMESFDGVGVVAGVGVAQTRTVSSDHIFKPKIKRRTSLRKAFVDLIKDEVQQKNVQQIKSQQKALQTDSKSKRNSLVWTNSVGTLTDLEDKKASEEMQKQIASPRATPITFKQPTNALFSSTATPLLSRQEAVAMRNVDCLDFAAGMSQDGESVEQPQRRSLRRMRSIDALELALAKMEKRKETSRSISAKVHDTIPESFSSESLTNEELASGATLTTVVDELQLLPHEFIEEIDDPMERSTTPRLMLTSPTGLRSPQEIHLEGQEYEPRSYSPEVMTIDRIIADSVESWKANHSHRKPEAHRGRVANDENYVADSTSMMSFANVPKRSSSKRRSRSIRTRDVSCENAEEQQLPLPSKGKVPKQRNSKSCHDLRGASSAAARVQLESKEIFDFRQMSGSEQVRALKRDVLQRSKRETKRKSTGDDARITAAVPCSPLDNDGDDPFNDLNASVNVAHTQSKVKSNRSKSSPIPFEPVNSRRPLSVTQAQIQIQMPTQIFSETSILGKKKSGVGIACLVEKKNSRVPITAISKQDENCNILLESPTAQIIKKRSSRTALR